MLKMFLREAAAFFALLTFIAALIAVAALHTPVHIPV
jgi:hypothetical protein